MPGKLTSHSKPIAKTEKSSTEFTQLGPLFFLLHHVGQQLGQLRGDDDGRRVPVHHLQQRARLLLQPVLPDRPRLRLLRPAGDRRGNVHVPGPDVRRGQRFRSTMNTSYLIKGRVIHIIKLHCASNTSCLLSAAAAAICKVGRVMWG